ncbi:MAG: peptidylprolyl isomerase [Bacteroidales bacterium]
MEKLSTNIKKKNKQIILLYLTMALLFSMHPFYSASAYNDDVLLVINDREITVNEFTRLWKKNNIHTEQESLEEYLELFVNFQLKVAHARDEGIHREPSFERELGEYRKQLAQTYLTDPGTEEKLVREAYERLLYDVSASHILVRLPPGYNPDDTLKAWEKAMEISERIIDGESFEKVARATSDDPSAKMNSGNLGYFTVFQMMYPFENAVYQTEPGKLSMPVRTSFGYHIIKVNDIVESRGELKVAHIMIGFNQYNEQEAKEKVMDVYKDLQAGYSFEMMAKDHSTDKNTSGQGGQMPWFGVGRIVPEFETAAFALEQPGDISEPVRTAYGWHIIKLIDHRDIPPFDEIKHDLHARVRDSADERSQLIREALVERLKQEWDFSETPGTLEIFYSIVDSSVFEGKWRVPENLQLNQVLFSISGENITQRDFALFISGNAYRQSFWPMEEYINSLYQEFVSKWLIEHEDRNLENKYPEFRFMMQEYRDGMLLFEITEREIWSKATSDSAGLAAFYENNKHNYMWEERISATIFKTEDRRIARRAARRARRSLYFSRRDDNWIIDRLNRGNEEPVITAEKNIFSKGDNQLTDRIDWEAGESDIYQINEEYHIVLVHDILEPRPKTLDEARGRVTADYQYHLERKWIEDLRDKYNVIINKDVLSDIK